MKPSIKKDYFNAAFYEKHYKNADTRIREPQAIPVLADFVFSYLRHLDLPVKRVLDAGCGHGDWQPEVKRHYPQAAYLGMEYSAHLCEAYGWQQGSLVDFKLPGTFDLIICQSVLQYLDDPEAKKAIRNLALHCSGALYLETVTLKDWDSNCDKSATDRNCHLRSGAWYKSVLTKYFRNAGGGLFLKKDAPVVLWELEGCE